LILSGSIIGEKASLEALILFVLYSGARQGDLLGAFLVEHQILGGSMWITLGGSFFVPGSCRLRLNDLSFFNVANGMSNSFQNTFIFEKSFTTARFAIAVPELSKKISGRSSARRSKDSISRGKPARRSG